MVVGVQIVFRTRQCTSKVYQYSKSLTSNCRRNGVFNIRLFSSTNSILSDRKYTEKHEWVKVDDGIGTVGISHYAQDALGDVVYAQLPDVGQELTQEEECGALESVKAASELYSPVSGKVLEKNSEVEEKPGLINLSCYDKGWLFKVELAKPDEINGLMDEDQYQQFLKTNE